MLIIVMTVMMMMIDNGWPPDLFSSLTVSASYIAKRLLPAFRKGTDKGLESLRFIAMLRLIPFVFFKICILNLLNHSRYFEINKKKLYRNLYLKVT